MKILLIVIAVLVIGIWFGHASLNDPGLITIAREPYLIEMPLALFVLGAVAAFAVLYLLASYLFSIFRAPKKVAQWNKERQSKNAQNDTLRGYARLIEGDWDAGEKDLTKRLDHCKTPWLNYLGAAYAAQQQQDYVKRDKYLDMAESSDPANRMAVDLTRARMLAQAGDYGNAKNLLESMHELAPANKSVLRLMSDVYKNTQDWQSLSGLLPKLEKCKALNHAQVCQLDVLARKSQMTDALDSTEQTTQQEYKALPRKRKTDASMAALYAKKLISEGELANAEGVVRKAIGKNWTSELAGLYGKTLSSRDLRGQINLATTWLATHQDDANVHLALARLNMANNQVEKAKHYYQQAIELGAGDEAFYELGAYHQNSGDQNTALDYYKQGLQATTSLGALGDTALSLPTSANSADVAKLESVVTPGMDDQSLVAVDTPATSHVEVVEVIEDEPVEKNYFAQLGFRGRI